MSKKPVSKEALIAELKRLLSEAFETQRRGALQSRLGRSYGYIDGYMRVLIDTGVASESELLEVVASERVHQSGPATKALSPHPAW
jgi:hypothetical protein